MHITEVKAHQKRLGTVRFQLYNILEKEKLQTVQKSVVTRDWE